MLEKGLQFIKEVVVKPENLAVAMGSGDLPVLATPAMVAFMENAALSAVEDQLPEGSTTVGAMIQTTSNIAKTSYPEISSSFSTFGSINDWLVFP